QNAVMTGSISQIQTNRSLVLFENLDSLDLNSANLLHCRSPFFAPRARRSLGAYRIPLETGLLIPSDNLDCRNVGIRPVPLGLHSDKRTSQELKRESFFSITLPRFPASRIEAA